jgi:hypothetical protein
MGLSISEGYYLAASWRLGFELELNSHRDSFHINLRLDKKYRDYVASHYDPRTSDMGTVIADSRLMLV